MLKTYITQKGQEPTNEQIREIEEAAKRPIAFDEDCPELSPDMLKALECAVVQRNCQREQSIKMTRIEAEMAQYQETGIVNPYINTKLCLTQEMIDFFNGYLLEYKDYSDSKIAKEFAEKFGYTEEGAKEIEHAYVVVNRARICERIKNLHKRGQQQEEIVAQLQLDFGLNEENAEKYVRRCMMNGLDNLNGAFFMVNNKREEIIEYLKTIESPTIEEVLALPEDIRVELIWGRLYYHATPLRVHQEILVFLMVEIRNYIKKENFVCKVYPRPFAVLLQGGKHYVEPDISVICDRGKIDERGCNGAPDWIIEILSPGKETLDMVVKLDMYLKNGVREYWIVDPENRKVLAYNEKGVSLYGFTKIKVGIFENLEIDFGTIWDCI